MADFSTIIQEINDDITTNGVGAITGAKLNEVLRDMIDAVNAEKQDPLTIDAAPTEGSTNPVQSGGVYEELGNLYQALSVADNCLFGGLVNHLESPSQGDDHRYYYITKQGGYFSHFDVTIPDDTHMAVMIYWSNILSRWATIGLWPLLTYVDAKADKVSGATNGDLAGLDAYGNLTDSGIAASDVATTSDLAGKQDTISDLSSIRTGAAAGETAYQKPIGGIPKTDLASGVQTSLGKADTAVQQVMVGTTTTGNAGTNASVTNSGTATAPVLDFTIPRGADGADGQDGADAVNPFKGWYSSANALPANPIVGDYAYVKGANASDPAAIYECTTAGTWSDSGRTADTSNVQTFASGEQVNDTYIDDTNLVSPNPYSIPRSLAVLSKLNKLGVTASAKELIISIFKKCAFVSADAEQLIDDLEEEFAGTRILMNITATMPSTYTVYDNQSLDSLRVLLTVTAEYDDGTTSEISIYTLSGELNEGTSIITVSYGGLSTNVSVNVTHALIELVFSTNSISIKRAVSITYNSTYGAYISDNTKRCAYGQFDKLLVGGKSYSLAITTSDARTQVGVQAFTDSALSKVADHQNLVTASPGSPSIDYWDSGWITFTDGLATVTIPESATSDPLAVIRGVRLSFKVNDGSSGGATIPTGYTVSLTMTEITNP